MTATDLAEHLAAGPDLTDQGHRDTWTIDDDELANWALRRLAAAQNEIARIRHAARTEIARVEAWADDAEQAVRHDVDFFTGRLIDYRRRLEAADPKLAKTYKLPAGSISRRAGRAKVQVLDEAALTAWALKECPEAVAVRVLTTPLADQRRYQPVGNVDDDGTRVLVDADGAVVPGVQVVTGPDTYAAKPADLTDGPF